MVVALGKSGQASGYIFHLQALQHAVGLRGQLAERQQTIRDGGLPGQAGRDGVQRALPLKQGEGKGVMTLEMLKHTKEGLLDQPVGRDTGKPDFGGKGIEDPLFIMMAPQAQTVELGENVQVARLEEVRPQAVSVQGNGAVVQPKKLHGHAQKPFDEQVSNDFFFDTPVGQIIKALNQMHLELQRGCVRPLPPWRIQAGAEGIGKGKVNMLVDVRPEGMGRQLGIDTRVRKRHLIQHFEAHPCIHILHPPIRFIHYTKSRIMM
ncbi:hypothetical protein D3C76_1004510 [compost metagenome]